MAIWSVCIFVGKLSEANAKQSGLAILRQKIEITLGNFSQSIQLSLHNVENL